MTEEYRHGGMRALNEEGRDATAGSGVEPEVSGRVEVGRRRWLEQEGAYHVPHHHKDRVAGSGETYFKILVNILVLTDLDFHSSSG
jgi:hypothetical protein